MNLLQSLKDGWDAFFEEWLSPGADVLLPSLAILLFLLVLARLGTRLVVPPDNVAWKAGRGVVWLVGFLCLCAAASVPVLVASDLGRASASSLTRPWVALLVSGLVGLVLLGEAHHPARWRSLSRAVVMGATGSAVVGLLLIYPAEWARTWALFCWTAGAWLALLGVVWVAAARGHDLRLQVEVLDGEGTANASDSQYLIGRLQALGSERPRGLVVPSDTDVTTLPTDALAGLPTGTLAKALLQLAQVVLPAVPWRVSVATRDQETVTVSISRNGRMTDESQIISRDQLQLPPVSETSTPTATHARAELLTASAAVVLLALSRRHPWLRNGLCGASDWRGTAAHVLAAGYRQAAKTQRQILLAGLDADPHNALARVALTTVGIADAQTAEQREQFRKEMVDLQYRIDELGLSPTAKTPEPWTPREPKPGYEALQLRVLYSTAAASFNDFLVDVQKGRGDVEPQVSRHRAVGHTLRLRMAAARASAVDAKTKKFVTEEVQGAADLLRESLGALGAAVPDGLSKEHVDAMAADAPATDNRPWLSRKALYDQACARIVATPRKGENRVDLIRRALYDLEITAVDESLRTWARHDPSFALLQRGVDVPGRDGVTPEDLDKLRRQFKRIVGDPPPSDFLALPPFSDHAAALRGRGITDAKSLLACHPWLLSGRLRVEPATARRWRQLAVLASWIDRKKESARAQDDEASTVSLVALLLTVDVGTVDQLQHRIKEKDALYEALVQAAADLAVVPTRAETVDRWCG